MTLLLFAIDFGASNTDMVAAMPPATTSAMLTGRWTVPSAGPPDEERVRALLSHAAVVAGALRCIAVTGGNREQLPAAIDGCPIVHVDEVEAIGRGGLALSDMPRGIIASAGSGTAVVAADADGYRHVTGSGVGGGTLVGLGRMLLGESDPRILDGLARSGNAAALNLTIGEVLGGALGSLPPDTTAVNFGRIARGPVTALPSDVAAALVNMIGQVIAVIAINAARATRNENIAIVGHLTDLPSISDTLHQVGTFYHAPLRIPPFGGYATAWGAMLGAAARHAE